ncbi:hypothetical protein OXPF_33970 [Oxobacter pfennigii]|uniref:Prenylated flavin chaperone LpdD-like domain-containing protein n=1 Tax=Oxobacter pfennigii TaxID=36849 RepID=A0A0P8W3I1_9CLOT|nr:hypothetical protein [Oxobacter pfennigii]KPU43147.1 hypothetical protein OXPF_33970 [Oxobacter pfennigii]
MYKTFRINISQGNLILDCSAIRTSDGIIIYIGGGEKAHIGSTVISQPRLSLTGNGNVSCTTSVINILGHKDDAIAVPVSEAICRHFNETTVVTAGVHIDNAGPSDIEKFIRMRDEIILKIIKAIESDKIK